MPILPDGTVQDVDPAGRSGSFGAAALPRHPPPTTAATAAISTTCRQLYLSSGAIEQLLRSFLATGVCDPQEEALLSQLLQHSLVLPGQQAGSPSGSPRRTAEQLQGSQEQVQQLLAALLELAGALADPSPEQQHAQRKEQHHACAVDDSPRVSEALAVSSFVAVPVWEAGQLEAGGRSSAGGAQKAQPAEGAARPGREELVQMALQALLSLKVRLVDLVPTTAPGAGAARLGSARVVRAASPLAAVLWPSEAHCTHAMPCRPLQRWRTWTSRSAPSSVRAAATAICACGSDPGGCLGIAALCHGCKAAQTATAA
jgi:hypothetical protein